MTRRLVLLLAFVGLAALTPTAFAQAPPTTVPAGPPTTTVPPTTVVPTTSTVPDEGGGPTLVATPNTGLVDGQTVRITGSGFVSFGMDYDVFQCPLPVSGDLIESCVRGGGASVFGDGPDGFLDVVRVIRGRFIETPVDCVVQACGAVMNDTNGPVVAPLSFASVISASPGFTG